MPKNTPSRPKAPTRTSESDHQLTLTSLTTFGFSEAEAQKLTPFAALTLRTMLEVMRLPEEKRVLVRIALSQLLEAKQQSVNLQELAMSILNAETSFPEEIRADLLHLASRLHRLA